MVIMRITIGVACLALVGDAAAQPDPWASQRGYGTPFVDAIAKKFFEAWRSPPGDLDLLFPGGQACDDIQAFAAGTPTTFSASPDGKQMLAITRVKLDKKTAKQLHVKAKTDPSEVWTVAIVIDGPTGRYWTASITSDDA